jgi:hypothetical protein
MVANRRDARGILLERIRLMTSMIADALRRLEEYGTSLERLLSDPDGHDIEAARQILAETREAIDRIEHGVYGSCLRCGGAIGGQRLLALPAARFCGACATVIRSAER